MKLFKTTLGPILQIEQNFYLLQEYDWDLLINKYPLHEELARIAAKKALIPNLADVLPGNILPPIQSQEIWAAGVTYERSKEARMKEAEDAGGGNFYDRVYDAERPEIFFKANRYRTVGHGEQVNIRPDSTWNVPEPELTLFVNVSGKIAGYCVGNDMSSRSIEGENPLYLPQAKTYDGCASIGPCLYIPESPIDPDTRITMAIWREEKLQYEDSVSISRMKRKHEELVEFLFRACSFPFGCFLMTGTCLVPPDSFTLAPGDLIQITIDHIGMLENTVANPFE